MPGVLRIAGNMAQRMLPMLENDSHVCRVAFRGHTRISTAGLASCAAALYRVAFSSSYLSVLRERVETSTASKQAMAPTAV